MLPIPRWRSIMTAQEQFIAAAGNTVVPSILALEAAGFQVEQIGEDLLRAASRQDDTSLPTRSNSLDTERGSRLVLASHRQPNRPRPGTVRLDRLTSYSRHSNIRHYQFS